MKSIFLEIVRYIRIYLLFFKNGLIAEMEFRANFFANFFNACIYVLVKMLYIIVVFKTGIVINGLSPYQILMFIGSYTIITGIMDGLCYPNFSRIANYVRNGELDFYIIKPISLQFMVTLRYFNFGLPIPNIFAGLIMVIVSWSKLGIGLNLYKILGYIFFTIIGVLLTYPLLLFPFLLSFWLVKTQALDTITWSLWDFNNMPMALYHRWLQRIGIFIIPLFLITNFAPMFVFDMLSPLEVLWAIIAPILFIFLIRLFWNFAIKKYTSASS